MAPPARRARAEMSRGKIPSSGRVAAALRNVDVSSVEVTCLVVRALVYTVHSVVVAGVLCARRCKMRRTSAATGQVLE